jgi:hypothetical protein
LFEEEGNPLIHALITNFPSPVEVERPVIRPRLSACNHPVNSFKVEFANGSNKRFNAQELGSGISFL